MVKAVFIDYMGTTVNERSPEMAEIIRHISKNSSFHEPKQVQDFILDVRRRYAADSYIGAYLTEDEIVDRLISDMEAQTRLTGELAVLHDLIRSHWVNATVFPDARTFFEQCPVPIYIITNIGLPWTSLYGAGCASQWAESRGGCQYGYRPGLHIPPSIQGGPGALGLNG